MAIYARNGRGSLVIDRSFRGLGRLVASTDQADTPRGRQTAEKMDAMLTMLATELGRRDLVRAVVEGTLTLPDLWEHYRSGEKDRLPVAAGMRRLFPLEHPKDALQPKKELGAVGRWLPTYRTKRGTLSPGHRETLRQKFRALERLDPKARVSDLPSLVQRLRERCEAKGQAPTFRLARAAVMAFLRSTMGRRDNPIWAAVANIPLLDETRATRARLLPKEAWSVAELMLSPHGEAWWTMCTTGMMPDEFFGEKFDEGDEWVEIHGTKREARERVIPKMGPIARPATLYKAFRKQLQAVRTDLVPYDGRRAFAHWLELAGIPRTRRKLYLGHAAGDVTDLYERHEVDAFLVSDREKFTTWLEAQLSETEKAPAHLHTSEGAEPMAEAVANA